MTYVAKTKLEWFPVTPGVKLCRVNKEKIRTSRVLPYVGDFIWPSKMFSIMWFLLSNPTEYHMGGEVSVTFIFGQWATFLNHFRLETEISSDALPRLRSHSTVKQTLLPGCLLPLPLGLLSLYIKLTWPF